MKKSRIMKIVSFALALVFCGSLLPLMGTQVSAAEEVPVITVTTVDESNPAINPILDMVLSGDLYSEGGPFTVTFEWRAEIEPLSAQQTSSVKVLVEGFLPADIGGKQDDGDKTSRWLRESTDWVTETTVFQNVGFYETSGTMYAGNILRFAMWYVYGEFSIRNLKITNAAGKEIYNMNTDPDIVKLMEQNEKDGIERTALDNLAAINRECSWVKSGFGSGTSKAYIGMEKVSGGNGGDNDETEPSGPVFEDPEDPTEPSEDPTEPSEDPTEPSEDPTEPSEDPTGPSNDPTEPSNDPTEPSNDPTEPSNDPTEPSNDPTDPSNNSTVPSGTQPQAPGNQNNANNNQGGLPTGAVIGIILGVVAVIAVVVVIIVKKKNG